MHNFRGFSDTLLPLRQINFLVGENSTGKSSFLKLLHALSSPHFWFSPESPFQEAVELGGFADMVSAWSPDKKHFQGGILSISPPKKNGRRSCTFSVHTFGDRDGSPYIVRHVQFSDGRLIEITFGGRRAKYKVTTCEHEFASLDDVISFFRRSVSLSQANDIGLSLIPKGVPTNPPIPILVGIVKSLAKGQPISASEFSAEVPLTMPIAGIAPIRTRPQRIYDGIRKPFSPEGDHTPFVLRRALATSQEGTRFAEKLDAFGRASGLFETITAHSFEKSAQAPFEIVVKFPGANLNVSNVGYGVSQVLPLIVEFLSRKKCTFAVQQPEVHLHPRAQAALGDLIAEVASEGGHRFILETHSDYLIDRCRLNLSKRTKPFEAQTVFFERTETGNRATVLRIDKDGRYPSDQPPAFREFFVREAMNLLEV